MNVQDNVAVLIGFVIYLAIGQGLMDLALLLHNKGKITLMGKKVLDRKGAKVLFVLLWGPGAIWQFSNWFFRHTVIVVAFGLAKLQGKDLNHQVFSVSPGIPFNYFKENARYVVWYDFLDVIRTQYFIQLDPKIWDETYYQNHLPGLYTQLVQSGTISKDYRHIVFDVKYVEVDKKMVIVQPIGRPDQSLLFVWPETNDMPKKA